MLSPTRLPTLFTLALALTLVPIGARAAPSQSQRCEAAADASAANFAKCRLDAEAKNAKGSVVGQAFSDALVRCSARLQVDFAKAQILYGAGNCPAAAAGDFDAYLSQCTDDVAVAAAGGTLTVGGCAESLLATGQTTCWNNAGAVIACAGTGQDGASTTGEPLAYVDNADGTITDSNTGLMWEKLSDDGSIHDKDTVYSWTAAVSTKIAALNSGAGYAGHSDWRLPNLRELHSIVNLENSSPSTSPAFNTACSSSCTVLTCSCTISADYWSSSTFAISPTSAWYVYFTGGRTDAGSKTIFSYVRAVRAGS